MQLPNLWLYATAILLLFVSIVLFVKSYENIALGFLSTGAIFIRLFAAYLDPFLNVWDERYHALVARNMMKHPFKPILIDSDILWYGYKNWCGNYIWLHKQPLFLWQMALSMKIFGVSEFSIRYPSVLMGALSVLLVYKITWVLTHNKITAFTAAIFMFFSHYQFELISGHRGMDHNDVAFGFYVLASFWAYAEYLGSKKLSWVILIGFFAGCAVLNKWLPGLLVFGGWGINIFIARFKKKDMAGLLHFLLALLICVVTFLPWQIYIFRVFPKEAQYEFAFNTRHIFEVIEGHSGDALFYWYRFGDYFGTYSWYIILPGYLLLLCKRDLDPLRISLLSSFLFVMLFYSLMVKTKIDSYLFVATPLGFIFMATAFATFITLIRLPKFVYLALSVTAGLIIFDFKQVVIAHTTEFSDRASRVYNTAIYRHLKENIPSGTKFIMNIGSNDAIDIMFFNNSLVAKDFCLSSEEFQHVKDRSLQIAVFAHGNNRIIPDMVRTYPLTYIIPVKLYGQ